ncbi:hypothetical protein WMY93_004589 [Mugilogobius chulae]|uniref:DNA topoisomerase n=17 Tax=Euteleostomi TaxID=117571 RepID=A0AAW0PSQ5_9GOBI
MLRSIIFGLQTQTFPAPRQSWNKLNRTRVTSSSLSRSRPQTSSKLRRFRIFDFNSTSSTRRVSLTLPFLLSHLTLSSSSGSCSSRKGLNGACSVHEYVGSFQGQNVRFKMTPAPRLPSPTPSSLSSSPSCSHVSLLQPRPSPRPALSFSIPAPLLLWPRPSSPSPSPPPLAPPLFSKPLLFLLSLTCVCLVAPPLFSKPLLFLLSLTCVCFVGKYNNWDKVDPAELFSKAPTEKKEANPKLNMVKFLQVEARGCDYVVLWLDCDKEGENICFEVLDAVQPVLTKSGLREQTVFRAKFSSITDTDIWAAMSRLSSPNQNEALSVDARQELDLRVGCAFTRFQTKYFQGKYGNLDSSLVSFGPCQTPTLGFCVERHDKITSFKPESYWVLQAKVESVSKKEKAKQRPQALNTVEMLRVASSALGMGPQHTMQIAERLYTQGYISYPRTETTQYPENFDLKGALKQQANCPQWSQEVKELLASGLNRPRKGTDAGDHPPITPMRAASEAELGSDGWRLFDYITRHFISTVSQDCKYLQTTISFNIGPEKFSCSGKTLISAGYTSVMPWQAIPLEEALPVCDRGDVFSVDEIRLVEKQTSPPDYLTEAELITLMEKHGIGTDASIPVHINNICQRNYVTVESGRRLKPTNLGIVLVHGYYRIDAELVLPTIRSAVEKQLNLIAVGKADFSQVLQHALDIFKRKFHYFFDSINRLAVGKCHRFMKYIQAKPSRLHCSHCDETTVFLRTEPSNFTKNSRFGCNECTHPSCSHSLSSLGIGQCVECESGVLVLDPTSGPKWRMACNKCNVVVHFFEHAHRVQVSSDSCDSCDASLVDVDFNKARSPLPHGQTQHTGCVFCDSVFQDLVELKHATMRHPMHRGGEALCLSLSLTHLQRQKKKQRQSVSVRLGRFSAEKLLFFTLLPDLSRVSAVSLLQVRGQRSGVMEEDQDQDQSFLSRFTAEFPAAFEPDTSLPVTVPKLKVCEEELLGLSLDLGLGLLRDRKAPESLASLLLHTSASETLQSDLSKFHCIRETEDEPILLDSAPVLRLFLNALIGHAHRWLQAPPTLPVEPRRLVSCHGIRNARRKMEDRHLVLPHYSALCGLEDGVPRWYSAVFDGHGGSDAAVFASQQLHVCLSRQKDLTSDPENAFKRAFTQTDELLRRRATRERVRSGSTAVAALIQGQRLHVAWLGDSQALLVKNGREEEIMEPHKPEREDEKQRIEDLGGCVTFMGCWRVNGTYAVSRAFGDFDQKPYVSAEADCVTLELCGDEDYLLLACDGFFDSIRPCEVPELVLEALRGRGQGRRRGRGLGQRGRGRKWLRTGGDSEGTRPLPLTTPSLTDHAHSP